jgi:hypothetical protein
MMRAREILEILDNEEFDFPCLDNGYVYLAATRLSLHRSAADWAMVFEVFGFNPRAGVPDVVTHTFGSRIVNRETTPNGYDRASYAAYRSRHPHDNYSSCWITDQDWMDGEDVADGATDLLLRGRGVPIPERAAYARHGIDLADSERVKVYELCRFLADVVRDDVLATPAERRAHVPDDLAQILVLEEWTHPDVVRGQKPSDVESFRQLARVLEAGDVSLYRPMTPPNTHWKNWPEGGSL